MPNPVLTAMLAQWRLRGGPEMMGRAPGPDDLIVPLPPAVARRRAQWQRQALENLAGAFSTPAADGPSKREKELGTKTEELEAKLVKKDNVIAEVTAELVATKKSLGSPERPHD